MLDKNGNKIYNDLWLHPWYNDEATGEVDKSTPLFIDLSKGQLNTSKLVRKPVQVKGQNGKVFTRMQWVDPKTGQPVSGSSRFGIDFSKAKKEKETAKDINNKWDEVSSDIKSHIQSSKSPDHIKNKQLHALDKAPTHHEKGDTFSTIASHPQILSEYLTSRLGEKGLSDARNKLKNATLTINTDSESVPLIKKDGYYSAYGTHELSEEGIKKYKDIMHDKNLSEKEKLDKLRELGDDWSNDDAFTFSDLSMHHDTHHANYGQSMSDSPPIFLSLNPDNNPEGGAREFGDSVIHVNPRILSDCSINKTDNLNHSAPVGKAMDMDHVKDMFILKNIKTIENGDNDWYHSSSYGIPDVPLEMQYHGNKISPEDIE
jgi:hypothetical protein